MLQTRATGALNVHLVHQRRVLLGPRLVSLHVKPQEFGLVCRLVKVCRCRVCRGCLSGSSVFLFCLRLSLSLSLALHVRAGAFAPFGDRST